MTYSLSNIQLKNYLIASSSPLTESVQRLTCCYEAGFSAAILKSTAAYVKTGTGYGRKIVYGKDGYYADSSFEREILTLEEGIKLYKSALMNCPYDMLLIPSVSASSLEPEKWIKSCKKFEECGAKLIQLDFFYLGTIKHDDTFFEKLRILLMDLCRTLNCNMMPKLNLNFEPDKTCKILKESGIKTVSILDSMRENPDPRLGLHEGTTSYFGKRQLPYTFKYLKAAKQQGLEVCAGGGVTSKKDVDLLLSAGADAVQVASYVLNRDFGAVKELLDIRYRSDHYSDLVKHNPWCDCENGEKCEKCGACVPHVVF